MVEFRLNLGPKWTDEPSLRLVMEEQVSDNVSNSTSMIFPARKLRELIEALENGPEERG